MKRSTLIITGVILIIILLVVWLYVLFFNTPQNDPNTFTDLNFDDTTDTTIINNDDDDTTNQPVVDVNGLERLRQLTTKPVAGYQEVIRSASSTPEVIYIESGTGHIFSIDSNTGAETRLSGITFKESGAGAITPNGRYVMIQSGSGSNKEFKVGEMDQENESGILTPEVLDENIITFKATTDNNFLYAVQTTNSIIAKQYYPISDLSETIFTVPFREGIIKWGDTALETHYAYPKASSRLLGFVYKIKAGQTTRLPIDGFGVSGQGSESLTLYSKQLDNVYKTFIYDIENDLTQPVPMSIIPSKCTSLHKTDSKLICGQSTGTYGNNVPDAWYKGTVSYTDDLWVIEAGGQFSLSMELLVSPEYTVGRQLDMINLSVSRDDSNVYFLNKNDQTLWVYELVIDSPEFGDEVDSEFDDEINSEVDTPII
jgi:hypothetical protein